MDLEITPKEVSIILGAIVMHRHVPFREAVKRRFDQTESKALDDFWERLLMSRDTALTSEEQGELTLPMTEIERSLLLHVFAEALAECGDSMNDLWVYLKTPKRSEIDVVVSKLETCSE